MFLTQHTHIYTLNFGQGGWPCAGASTRKSHKVPARPVIIILNAAEKTGAQRGLPKLIRAQQTEATAAQSAGLASLCIPEEGAASSHPVFTEDSLRGGP